MSDEQYAAIRARRSAYLTSHSHMNGFACCPAHASADDVPALLAEVDRLRAERDQARAELDAARSCDCFAATFHANTCQYAVITWNGTTYNTGHWLIDCEGVPWMPHSLANGMTGELLLLCNGDYSNDPSLISEVLGEWGPLTAGDPVDHSKILNTARES
ncbi:hypothetical protein [Kitasatospora sp. NBC_01302]|uniref:hypothetical protein n=1 Tax=Kitasatospora sp. NBC_01302 TaxID=2903575 RepID=UPI002E152089|nr:hypothetical protein OG294_13855 [Kitasatospora sp. NBC_01302]